MEGTLSKLGLGIALGWLALPLLGRLAQQGRRAAPAAYHRALLWSLALGVAVLLVPFLHGAVNAALWNWFATRRTLSFDRAGVVSDLVVPIIGPSDAAWPESPLSHALVLLGGLWCFAGVVGAVRLFRSFASLQALCRRALPPPAAIVQRGEQLALAQRIRAPQFALSTEVTLPFTCGIFRPIVVLPSSAVEAGEEELDFMLRHELTHVRRRDAAVAFFVNVASMAFPLHPTLRRLAAEIAFAREASVDAEVAPRARLQYARFLVASAERSRSPGAAWLCMVSMADTALSRRIEMLVNPSPSSQSPRRPFLSLAFAGAAIGALVCLAPASFGSAEDANAAAGGEGQLPREVIQRVVRSHFGAFRACYEQLPRPRPATTMQMHFVIGVDGRVRTGHIDSQQVPELGRCSTPAMLSLVFPAPKGGEVSVVYPIALFPDEGESAPAQSADGQTGRLPAETIRSVVQSHFDDFRACYQELAEPRPSLRIQMHFTIGRDGQVEDGHVDAEASPELGACAHEVLSNFTFPAPQGGIVTVSYPIEFAPN